MQEREPLLHSIRTPQDLRKLRFSGLNRVAAEIRELIISTVNSNGGHLASNLGVVELTIALHLVFDSPNDRIVWDVGHQCYAHKLLTGRYDLFHSLRKSGGVAGFPKASESPHDSFNTGHASTSISAALGMLASEKILGTGHRAVAVIGDGALTGGLAYEALSHSGQLQLPLVVILNDNKMSISPNVGGVSKYLSRLSMKAKYQKFRRTFDTAVKKIPFAGNVLFNIVVRLKRAVKAVFYSDNFFVDLGFEYVGPIEGHDIPLLTQVLRDAKNLNKPVVVHVITRKGKGYDLAENDPGTYHGVPAGGGARALSPGASLPERRADGKTVSFTKVFGDTVLEAARQDSGIAVITAAMGEGTGLSPFRETFPERFFDVGIAEEHAVTFAAGLASGGVHPRADSNANFHDAPSRDANPRDATPRARPVVAVYSTFIQRACDQIIHDVCLQKLPVIFALDRAGLVGDDGETHQGIFDISFFRSAPDLTILAPAGGEELALMLRWALSRPDSGPVMIRYPKATCPAAEDEFSLPLETGRGVFVRRGDAGVGGAEIAGGEFPRAYPAGVCIVFTGSLYPEVLEAADILESRGIESDLYNLRFLKPLDEDYFAAVINRYDYVIIAEEGVKAGGFGEYASEIAVRKNCSCGILALGVKEAFDALGTRNELLRRNGLDGAGIAAEAERFLAEIPGKDYPVVAGHSQNSFLGK